MSAGNRSSDQSKMSTSEMERTGTGARHADMSNNVNAKIENPLADIPDAQLQEEVSNFANKHGISEHAELITRGAFLAREPASYATNPALNLSERELLVLQEEKTRKWKHPNALYMTIAICSIGAAVQGWDQTGSNGANLSFPKEFGIGHGDDPDHPNYDRDNWLVGLVNSSPYIGSALLGCWLSDPINYYIGRRGTIFVSAIFCIITPIGGAISQTWEQLMITRLLMGIGMGMKGSCVPIFAAENSPAAIRGALVMSWQLWTAFGILLGLVANLAVYRVGDIAWRLQIGSAFIPAVPLAIGIYFCPESPRWYIKKGRMAEAFKSLKRLRRSELQAARDLYYINAQLEYEATLLPKTNFFKRFIELFTVPRIRRATLAAFTVMIAQQMCGINIIAFYSSTIFVQAGADEQGALLASFGFGLVNFIFAWPAIFTIDTFGRRSLLLFTFPQMAWTLLAAGFCFYIPTSSKAHLGMVAFFVFLFAAFYSPGEGPVPFAYSAEVFPLSHREIGMGFAVATCLFWAAVLSITFPKILAVFTPTGAFGFYAGLNVLAFFMIFLFVPETKQRTLEELDYIFAVPTGRFISYQTKVAVPWWTKRYVMRKKGERKESLYHFDRTLESGSSEGSVGSTEKA